MKVNRRDFFVTTAVGAVGAAALGAETSPPPVAPEAMARYQWIINKWGASANFTDAEKVDMMRLLEDNVKGLQTMRAFALDNGTEPSR